jgi:ADP-ribosylglycohydrolase
LALDLASALSGCLLGQALGDALGFVVEARPPAEAREYVERCLRAGEAGAVSHPDFPFGQYSDDTQLARELLLSVVEARGWSADRFAGRIAQLFATGRDVGAGPGTRAAALRLHAGEHWTRAGTPVPYAGNGSAMRVLPVGILFRNDLDRVAAVASEQSRVTHLDPRCEAGAIAVATAGALASRHGPLDTRGFINDIAQAAESVDGSVGEAIRLLEDWIPLSPSTAAQRLLEAGLDPAFAGTWQGISAFVIPSTVWSLYAFLHSPDDYWATVCTAIEVGGDTDTMAAIAGGISGARLGPAALPARLTELVTDRGEWGDAELRELARSAARLVKR